MNASGGLPANTSSGRGRSTCAENVSAIASTSRWKCIAALGRPVVPEVNAIIATSSAAVGTFAKSAGLAASIPNRSPPPLPPYWTTRMPSTPAWIRSAVCRASHSARSTLAISPIVASSPARSSGIVATTTAPAFIAPNQQATSHGLFGARSSTRLPGRTPRSSTSARATRLARASRSAYDQTAPPASRRQGRSPPNRWIVRSSSSSAQFSRCGYRSSGSSKTNCGHWSAGGRWSRAKVSRWAEGDSSIAYPSRHGGAGWRARQYS